MKEYPLGALKNEKDNRDIPLSAVASALGVDVSVHPTKNITDISAMPVENQKDKGTCVGQAEGIDAQFQDFIETKKVTRTSKRFLYTQCKLVDGNSGEGTYPRVCASIRVNKGIAKADLVPDDNDLPYADYLKVTVTPEILTDASGRRSKGYTFPMTLDELKTAIDLTKAFNATLQVGDWSSLPVKPIYSNGSNRGNHRVWIFGYEDAKNGKIDDTKIYFRNSWGLKWANGKNAEDRKLLEAGNGYFWWSEYQGFVSDMIAYIDMPNEIIDYAKSQQFIFTRQLQRGMKGTDVMELQKRLDKEIAFDGVKCYTGNYYDTSFGAITEKSVQRYQKTKGIVSSGTPATTGYGRVGSQTMAMLNKPVTPQKKSLLNKWADAIQSFEGWYPGSRSYRNNNPGNIKYIGQKRAIGSDGTFCKFATYEDGRAELIDLLTRASSGQSTLYSPEMTLIDFYNRYAPSSDNNNPNVYASAVAKMMGISVYTKIKNILNDTATLSDAPNSEEGEEITNISMKNITSSATKLVLLYIVLILGLLASFAVVWGIIHDNVNELTIAIVTSFTGIVGVVIGHYFNKPGDPTLPGGGK